MPGPRGIAINAGLNAWCFTAPLLYKGVALCELELISRQPRVKRRRVQFRYLWRTRTLEPHNCTCFFKFANNPDTSSNKSPFLPFLLLLCSAASKLSSWHFFSFHHVFDTAMQFFPPPPTVPKTEVQLENRTIRLVDEFDFYLLVAWWIRKFIGPATTRGN